MKKRKIFTFRRCLVLAFLAVFALISFINYRGSYLEYLELGENFLATYLTRLKIQSVVMAVNLVVIYLIMYFTGRSIKKGLKVFFEQEKKEMPKLPNKSIAIVVAIIESLIVMKVFTPTIIMCLSNITFGETDVLFGLDISFYMFVETLIKMLATYFIIIWIFIIIYTFGYYVIVFNKYFDAVDKETLMKSKMMSTIYMCVRLIAVGFAVYISICSMDVVFDNFLTTDNGTELTGAGLVDSTIKYWGYNILAVILLVVIFKAVGNFKKGEQRKVIKDVAVVPVYLVALFFTMMIFDFAYVRQNRYDKEETYIEANISATKKAYGIEVDVESIDYSGTITVDEVSSNENIINNAVLVSKDLVLSNLNENQTGTGYYTYSTASIASYTINGVKSLVYLSPREILSSKRTYNSRTYEYTHGYGVIVTSATSFTEEGEIEYLQNDISGEKEEIVDVEQPRIYYGLETDSTVVTNTKSNSEFDYADDTTVYEKNYTGDSGLSLNFIDRVILALKERNFQLIFTTQITSESKILTNRNIIERAQMVLGDVIYDEDPYIVVDDNGDLYWVLDAYTISSQYPYSTYTEIEFNDMKKDINYIRNSIKVIINAYTGEMKYYITDRTDPIAMAYRKIYPELFEDLDSEIPQTIQDQFIYPQYLYEVQSTLLEEYHNTKADVLYRGDDTWEKATYSSTNSKTSTLDAYYTMVKIDDEETIGLVQIYTPKDKQTVNSYLIGTVENGQNKLTIKSLSSDTTILTPTQLDTQIAQDESIQDEIDSLSVTGAKVTKSMIVVPVDNTLLYIEPIYQTLVNEDNIPKLKKVVVASGNKMAIGDNLEEAVENLISQYASNIELNLEDEFQDLLNSIVKANDNLSDSLKSGDWELMGSDIQKLQELINSLEKQLEEQESEESSNEEDESSDQENTTDENETNDTTENNTSTLQSLINKITDSDSNSNSNSDSDPENDAE